MACCCGLGTACGCGSIRETITVTFGGNLSFGQCAIPGYDIQGTYVLNRVDSLRWYYEEPTTLACAPHIFRLIQLTATCFGEVQLFARQYLPNGYPPPNLLNPGAACCFGTPPTFGCSYDLLDTLPKTPFPGVLNWMCAEYPMTQSAQMLLNGRQNYAQAGSSQCNGTLYTISP